MNRFELIPHNGRKSFYGKAIVTEVNGNKTLASYMTDVARIDKEGRFIKLWDGYSVTTMNHVNAFRIMNGLNALSKKEWESMETEKPHSDMPWQQSYKAMIARRNAGYSAFISFNCDKSKGSRLISSRFQIFEVELYFML